MANKIREAGRPVGSRNGTQNSERVKMMFGLYPEDIERLNDMEEELNISKSGVIRRAILELFEDLN